jgi:hypothetical protein
VIFARCIYESVIFENVPLQYVLDHSFVCVRPSNHSRFQQEEESASGIPVRVILATDLMHEIMTECQLPKCTFLARTFLSVPVDDRRYLLANCLVIRIGKAVDEKAPVNIASGCKFIPAL